MNFIETSAFTRNNVDKAFYDLAYKIYQKIQNGEVTVDVEGSEGVKPGRNSNQAGGKGGVGGKGKKNSSVQLSTEKVSVDCTKQACCGAD
jgi:hypothetical protein